MRYCSFDDCYYLHWDNPVCKPLARKYGLDNGLFRSAGVERITEGNGEVCINCNYIIIIIYASVV